MRPIPLLRLLVATAASCASGSGTGPGSADAASERALADSAGPTPEGGGLGDPCYGPLPNGSQCPAGYCFMCSLLDVNPRPACSPQFCHTSSSFTGASCITAPCLQDGAASDAPPD
jgi:hypothetical protein